MITIIIIIAACWFLYKSGAVRRFMNSCRLEENTTKPAPLEITPRERLEADAKYILSNQGKTSPETVRTMSNEMLTHIIREYLDI